MKSLLSKYLCISIIIFRLRYFKNKLKISEFGEVTGHMSVEEAFRLAPRVH